MEAALKNGGFQVSPTSHPLPQDSGCPGRNSLATTTPLTGAGKLALQNPGVLVQGMGTYHPLTPEAPPRPRAVLRIPDGTAITSPSFPQPLLSSHCGSSPQPRSFPPGSRAGAFIRRKKKTSLRTKDVLHLAEMAGQYTSPSLRQYSAHSSVSQVQIISQPRANQGEGTSMPADSLRQTHPRTQGRWSESETPKRLQGQLGNLGLLLCLMATATGDNDGPGTTRDLWP